MTDVASIKYSLTNTDKSFIFKTIHLLSFVKWKTNLTKNATVIKYF